MYLRTEKKREREESEVKNEVNKGKDKVTIRKSTIINKEKQIE